MQKQFDKLQEKYDELKSRQLTHIEVGRAQKGAIR
jgi:hypothetical protein